MTEEKPKFRLLGVVRPAPPVQRPKDPRWIIWVNVILWVLALGALWWAIR